MGTTRQTEIAQFRASGIMDEHIKKFNQEKILQNEKQIKIERVRIESLSYKPTINRFAIGVCLRTIRQLTQEIKDLRK